jgi:hypothetical protein
VNAESGHCRREDFNRSLSSMKPVLDLQAAAFGSVAMRVGLDNTPRPPFIRYRSRDRGTLLDQPSVCGGGWGCCDRSLAGQRTTWR